MPRSDQGRAFVALGSAICLGCIAKFVDKFSGGQWEWSVSHSALLVGISVGILVMALGLIMVHRGEILFLMDEGPQATMVGREEFYFLTIINQSQSPIEVTHVWLELSDKKKVPVADSVSHLPVVVPQHKTWKTQIMKLRAPDMKDWFLRGRAQLLDGRVLRSSGCKPQPYVRVRSTTLE